MNTAVQYIVLAGMRLHYKMLDTMQCRRTIQPAEVHIVHCSLARTMLLHRTMPTGLQLGCAGTHTQGFHVRCQQASTAVPATLQPLHLKGTPNSKVHNHHSKA
jgi:hypothetical protein